MKKRNPSQTESALTLRTLFQRGDGATKLSFILMGAANLKAKQWVKGLLFLLIEVSFIGWFATQGLSSLHSLINLGTKKQGWQMDPKLGIEVQQAGDNSMLLLLFGICALLLIALFIGCYMLNLRSALKLARLKEAGKPAPTLRQDLKSLINENFHLTLMSIPLLGVLAFTVLPLLYMISIAFTSYDHNHLPPKNLFDWVGFENFGRIISGNISGTFFPLLAWTLVWAVLATVTTFFFGVLLALFIHQKGVKLKGLWRTLFVITMAVPQFVSLLLMANLLNGSGPINALLQNWGLIQAPIPFLTDGLMAKITVIVVNMWVGIPVTMLVATGIITNLSTDQVEAARIDGASKLQIFWKITFPQILFVMTPSLIQQFIGNINNFNIIFLLTGGAPANSNYHNAGETDLLVTWLYKLTVGSADYNLASVIGILIFILSAAFSLFAYTRSNSFKVEGGNES